MQHSQSQADHLQILTPRSRRDIPRLSSYIVDNRPLQPGNQEMRALVNDLLLHSGKPVEDDGARTSPDVVQGGVHEHGARGHGNGQPIDIVEAVGCHGCAGLVVVVVRQVG